MGAFSLSSSSTSALKTFGKWPRAFSIPTNEELLFICKQCRLWEHPLPTPITLGTRVNTGEKLKEKKVVLAATTLPGFGHCQQEQRGLQLGTAGRSKRPCPPPGLFGPTWLQAGCLWGHSVPCQLCKNYSFNCITNPWTWGEAHGVQPPLPPSTDRA